MLTWEDSEKEGSIEHQNLDLQPLPIELKYAYLEEGEQFPVVISLLLNDSQESNLLDILRKYKQAIGWKILYQKRIQASEITTKVTESTYVRGSAQKISQIVTGRHYLSYFDSPWVSPTQVVLKKIRGDNFVE